MTRSRSVAEAANTRAPVRGFTGLLDALLQETSGEHVTLGQLMDIAGRRTFGPVILLLGFISISPLTIVPGANWLVAAVTLLFAVQLMFGRRHPWLPKKLLNTQFPRPFLEKSVNASRKVAHVADSLTSPRLVFLTEPPFVIGVAIACIVAALATFPLGLIPLGPVLPGVSIVLLGIGMTARDGVFLGLATFALAGAGMLLWRWVL